MHKPSLIIRWFYRNCKNRFIPTIAVLSVAANMILVNVILIIRCTEEEEFYNKFKLRRTSKNILQQTAIAKRPRWPIQDHSKEIAVVTILHNIRSQDSFTTAMNTVSLDFKLHTKTLQFFLQRHCIAAYYLMRSTQLYHLFIDADTAVINPKHRIEEFLFTNKDIVFCNRLWGFEIMSGSFFARKSEFAVKFLHNWANYDGVFPNADKFLMFPVEDNLSLQSAILDFALVNKSGCEEILRSSTNMPEINVFVACTRILMLKDRTWTEHIAISRTVWVRDGWITYSKWSDNDFMIHGWQESDKNIPYFGYWMNPFLPQMSFDKRQCKLSNQWLYWPLLHRSTQEIDYALWRIVEHVGRQFRLISREVRFFLNKKTFAQKMGFHVMYAGREEYPDYADQFNRLDTKKAG